MFVGRRTSPEVTFRAGSTECEFFGGTEGVEIPLMGTLEKTGNCRGAAPPSFAAFAERQSICRVDAAALAVALGD